jgi:hypothetical protein
VRVTAPVPGRPAARIDSVQFARDTLPTRVRADSIQPPIARAEMPVHVRVGPPLRWTRDSVLASGALTLTDLLERVAGVTTFRSGWLASAQTAAYLGDFRRVRVFRDGVELDFADPRGGGLPDLLDLQLWQADELVIERTASEVRVHVRTWTTRNTTAYTRVDIGTGDEDTNQYRGFYGKRWGNGVALQVGAQQLGTGTRNRFGGGGDATNALARVGWARGPWSVDGFYSRLDRSRDRTLGLDRDSLLPGMESRRDEAYVRAAYGDPERGAWAQALAGSLRFTLEGTSIRDTVPRAAGSPPRPAGEPPDSIIFPDSAASRAQYVLAAGYTLGSLRGSVTNRMRSFDGRTFHAPALRLSYERPLFGAAAYAERTGADSASRLDLTGRVSPLPWLAIQALASRTTRSRGDEFVDENGDVLQLDVGVRVGRMWVTAGAIRRSSIAFAPPLVYENVYTRDTTDADIPVVDEPSVQGAVFTARGRFYKDVYADVAGTVWDKAGTFRPQYQARVELGVATNWLSRFPSGNLGIRAAVVDDYRSRTPFILGESAGGSLAEVCQTDAARCAPPSNALTGLLEIRIQRGVVWYQLRNALNRRYELVPGILMPRPINVYGVRWEFWG